MVTKPSYSLSQISKLTKYSLAELLFLILQNNDDSVYLYTSKALLAIPQDQLKRIQNEYDFGKRSHLVEIWHPYLTKPSIGCDVFMTLSEFKSAVSEKQFDDYEKAVSYRRSEISKNLSFDYRPIKIYTKAKIAVKELIVMRDSALIEKLFEVKKIHYQNLFLLPFLDKNHPGYSTQLAAGVESWLDLNVNNLRKPHMSLVDNAEAIIESKFPEIEPTPRGRIASWVNKDDNKKHKKDKAKIM